MFIYVLRSIKAKTGDTNFFSALVIDIVALMAFLSVRPQSDGFDLV